MNENLIACAAVLIVAVVLLAFGMAAFCGWLLVRFSR
jgi:hypothetical protein